MKIKNTVIMSEDKLSKQIETARQDGIKAGIEKSEAQVKNLKKTIARYEDSIETLEAKSATETKRLKRKISQLEDEVAVYEADREVARDLIKGEIKNADQKAALDARKESLDAQAASIRERESKIDSKEESNYKKGYADGIADGLRKISEVTAKDREDAMKIAMVSAASHTPTANIKELNNVHQLTEGSSNTEG